MTISPPKGSVGVSSRRSIIGSYDATRHLLEAINIAGPDRQGIRRTLAAISVAANREKHFEETQSPGTPMFASLHEGRWKFHPLPRR